MITERQEKLLNFLVKEYIDQAKPVSSKALKKVADLDVSAATVRNDLQVLTKKGFIEQPHTSAGRIPTERAYKYLSDKAAGEREEVLQDFIVRQIRFAHEEMEREMRSMEELMQTLEKDNLFEILTILDTWHKKIM